LGCGFGVGGGEAVIEGDDGASGGVGEEAAERIVGIEAAGDESSAVEPEDGGGSGRGFIPAQGRGVVDGD
jgi:hypothetical protein